MNVRCPSCQTVFRVDPARVPASGIRAKCSRCGNPFTIQPQSTAAAQPAPPAAAAPAAPAAPRPVMPAPQRPAATTSPTGTPVFGSKDPHSRAQRIARALVSDIVAYHKKKVEDTLAAGTMRTEFREEIMKSWEEYVAQVGNELAKGTPYFRNALNDILARGQKVF